MSTAAPELRDPPPPPISVREKGYEYGGPITIFYDDLANEPTPELVWPNSIVVFDRMRRQDAQVSSVLRAIPNPPAASSETKPWIALLSPRTASTSASESNPNPASVLTTTSTAADAAAIASASSSAGARWASR